MKINPRIRPDQVIAKTSRETFITSEHDLPPGAVIIAHGPPRAVLWAELCALGNVAAMLRRDQS